MENNKQKTRFTKTPLYQIMNLIDMYSSQGNQEMVNELTEEVAIRFWYPGFTKTRLEFKKEFGYKEIIEDKPKRKVKRK